MITYHILPFDLGGHRYRITVDIPNPDPEGQLISLPAWIPGSYMIRDFARNIETLTAHTEQGELLVSKKDSHTWQIHPTTADTITVQYVVYAWDTSVRAAYLDDQRGFFNGTSVFVQVHGKEHQPCLVEIATPKEKKNWKVYTSLPESKEHATKRHQAGFYLAPNYDALIDHPVEMGRPLVVKFKAFGAEHEMVFAGAAPYIDLKRIAKDCAKICTYQISLFDPEERKAPFFDSSTRYVFLVFVLENGYGGLEHRASTALQISRQCLPTTHGITDESRYTQFLSLVSHEYFHTWNVKRIKPQVFAPYDLYQASHTQLLWIFEGFTDYYNNLCLYRAGVIAEDEYFHLLEKNLSYLQNLPARHKMSLAQSSFDAWTKYYKQDENAPNSIVSYYTKGALVAWMIDLYIRTHSRYSLDDVLRFMWQKYGKHFFIKGTLGVLENEFHSMVLEVTGVDISTILQHYVYGTADIPYNDFLKPHHLAVRLSHSSKTPYLGVRTRMVDNEVRITQVIEGSPAHQAGLSAGDVLVAIDKLRVRSVEEALQPYNPNDKVKIDIFRRDELCRYKVKLGTPLLDTCKIIKLK